MTDSTPVPSFSDHHFQRSSNELRLANVCPIIRCLLLRARRNW